MNTELFVLLFTYLQCMLEFGWNQLAEALCLTTIFCGRLVVNRQIVLAGEQTQSRMVLQRPHYMKCRFPWVPGRVEWFAVINLVRGQVSLIFILDSHKFNWYEVLLKTSWELPRQAVLISWKFSDLLELGTYIPPQYEASECLLFHTQVQKNLL